MKYDRDSFKEGGLEILKKDHDTNPGTKKKPLLGDEDLIRYKII